MAEQKSDCLITYDIKSGQPDPHKPLLLAAEKEGLLYVRKGKSYVSRLPNTTLWGVFDNVGEADKAFDRAVACTEKVIGKKILVEKWATTGMSDTLVFSDVRKTPEPKWTGKTSFETSRLHQVNDPTFA